jgi:hypothetical protein
MRMFLVSAWATPINAMLARMGSRAALQVILFIANFQPMIEPLFHWRNHSEQTRGTDSPLPKEAKRAGSGFGNQNGLLE